MKLATWNVNSIRARRERTLDWLRATEPDVLCLQETKVTDDDFPADDFRALGYEAAIYGQRTYNGVAILSRSPLEDVARGFAGDDDEQARFVAATTAGIRVLSAYFPNGQSLGSEKYAYKLDWMRRLEAHIEGELARHPELALCGDFNVAPADLDVYDPAKWADTVLCHPEVREALERVRAHGLTDLPRQLHPDLPLFSWWDYRQLAFPKGRGLRIDHVFVTEPLAARATGAGVDRNARKGKQPSDHAPVWADFRDA